MPGSHCRLGKLFYAGGGDSVVEGIDCSGQGPRSSIRVDILYNMVQASRWASSSSGNECVPVQGAVTDRE